MTDGSNGAAGPDISVIERLLAEVEGKPVLVSDSAVLAPWAVMRCVLDDSVRRDHVPGSVIVKWLRSHPANFRTDPRQVGTERAALEFLAELGFEQAPRLIAAHPATNSLVLEDLAPRQPLCELIWRDGPVASRPGMHAYARAVGRLHVRTVGLRQEFSRRRARYCAPNPGQDRVPVFGPRWPETLRRLAELDVPLPTGARAELDAVRRMLDGTDAEHRQAYVLTNGDPETNNFLWSEQDECGAPEHGRLIDFEFAGYRHPATNLTWINVPGPSWLVVADEASEQLERTYRDAIGDAVPVMREDRWFGTAMAAACFAHAFERLNRFPTVDARPSGDSSRLQLVTTLVAAADTATRHDALPQLASWVRAIAERLRNRWPDTDLDISAIPSYSRR